MASFHILTQYYRFMTPQLRSFKLDGNHTKTYNSYKPKEGTGNPMIPHKFNAKLVILAVIGMILFIGSAQVTSLSQDDSMQTEMGSPLVSKEQAKTAAIAYIQSQFTSLIPSEATITYESNKTLSGYLQKHKLTKLYKAEFNKRYPLDFWQIQIWDELSAKRYLVDVGLEQPNVVGWSAIQDKMQTDEEKAALLTEAQAFELAKNFAKKEGYVLADFHSRPVVYKSNALLFEFENSKAKIGDAKQILSIGVSGNQVTSYHVDFEVPAADSVWMNKQDTYAQWLSLVSLVFMLIFAITAIVISIRKRKLVSFSRGWLLTGIFLVISFVGAFNTLPSAGMNLGEKNATVYLIVYLIFTLGINFLLAATVYFTLITGVYMWQQKGWNAWPRWKETRFGAEVFYGMGRGYLLCIFILGVQQVLFLFAGKTFHSFAINDPSQSEYNMLWPTLLPTMAWMAAISEEIIFRLFAIVLFQKLLRIRFLAILIPSVIWALGHTAYSIYPSYTRLFEVTILGFIFSYTFLRYGLITAIFTHAIMDSLLMGLSLLYSAENSSYVFMGIFYIILPAIIAYLIRFIRRKDRQPQFHLTPENLQ
jgi:hypothetical protein